MRSKPSSNQIDILLNGEHSRDWEFWQDETIFSGDVPKWTCKCGHTWKGHQGYAFSIDAQAVSRRSAWSAFMEHKYGEGWNEGQKFDRVWAECFPVKHSPSHASVMKGKLARLPSTLADWIDRNPGLAIALIVITLYCLILLPVGFATGWN